VSDKALAIGDAPENAGKAGGYRRAAYKNTIHQQPARARRAAACRLGRLPKVAVKEI